MKSSMALLIRYSAKLGVALLMALAACTLSAPTQAQSAAALQARHAELHSALASNQFQRPLHLESSKTSGSLTGAIYARLDAPYAVVGPALQDIKHWCDILILNLNVKSCRASNMHAADTLNLSIGRKYDQPLAEAYPVQFRYKVVAMRPDYLQVTLHAKSGPLGTKNYHIMLEVAALDAQHSFLHMSYSYEYGLVARIAMQSYLATMGRNKVGFSIIGHESNGQPLYLRGIRGVIERNTMRYYLAIEAYLGALSAPADTQVEKRLNDWYTSIERYPAQLHELERSEYMDMKRKEIRRQRALASDPQPHQ